MPRRRIIVIALAALSMSLSSAWALVVSDPGTTARNAVTAVLKSRILEMLAEQHLRLRRMAGRLSVHTNLNKYALPDSPRWGAHRSNEFLYTQEFNAALMFGNASGTAYFSVSHPVAAAHDALNGLSSAARQAVMAQLATLNAADASAIAAIHQTGQLRVNGRTQEMSAIEALEADVIDPSQEQSATAVLDKISGAALIAARQRQARLQFLTAIVEQLLVDNKRARDTEAAVLNMQLGRLRGDCDEGGCFLAGAGNDLRTWRQP